MTSPHFAPGQIIDGKYTIRSELGRSDVSATYAAIAVPNRELAIRVLDPALPHLSVLVDHLRRVAGATRPLTSRRILAIEDIGTDGASRAPYLVSPLVESPPLSQLVSLCPLTLAELPAFVVDLAQAIEELHAAGVAHLGLSPSNVFVGPNQRVRVTDAGVHGVLAPGGDALRWAAPEQQSKAAAAGPAADVFAMALLVFYAATGHHLVENGPLVTAAPAASTRAKELGVELPAALDEPFRRALSLRPEERFPAARELATKLVAALQPGAPPPVFAPESAPVRAAAPVPLPATRTALMPKAAPPPTPTSTARMPKAPPAPSARSLPAAALTPSPRPSVPAMPAPAPVPPPPSIPAMPVAAPPPSVPAMPVAAPPPSAPEMPIPSPPPSAPAIAIAPPVALPPPPSAGAIPVAPLNMAPPPAMAMDALPVGLPARPRYLWVGVGVGSVVALGIVGIAIAMVSRPKPIATAPTTSTAWTAPSTPITVATTAARPAAAPPAEPTPVAARASAAPEPTAPEPVATAAPADTSEPLTLKPGQGELRIVCEPVACANIAIDGVIGTKQGPFALRGGKHGIGVSTDGYGGLWELVDVPAGERTVQHFKLTPQKAPTKSCGKFLDRCK